MDNGGGGSKAVLNFKKIYPFWHCHPSRSRKIHCQQNILDKLKKLKENTFPFCLRSKSLLITKKPKLYPTDSVDFRQRNMTENSRYGISQLGAWLSWPARHDLNLCYLTQFQS